MNFTQLEAIAPALLKSGRSVELKSAPGRGKSEFVGSLPGIMSKQTRNKWGYATAFLATYTPTDLMGYMIPEKQDGRTVSTFTMPPWMLTRNPDGSLDGKTVFDYEYGILNLDEYGQGESDTKRASAELLLNKMLGIWKLGRGWSVWACSNRASDRSGVTKDFDFVINRRLELHIQDDIASWERWADRVGVDPVFRTFAVQNPHIVFSDGVPEKQGPWCTPRSLRMTEEMLMCMSKDGMIPTSPEAVEVAGGMIGQGGAAQLFAMIKLAHVMPKLKDIVNDPTGTKVPEAPDAQYLICYQLAARADGKNIKPVVTYMERFPKEFSVTFARSAVRRDPSLVDTAVFGEWCVRNESIMAVIAAAGGGA